MELKTAEKMAEHFGQKVEYELWKERNVPTDGSWVERSMPITGHLIAAFEDNRVRNVKLSEST